MLVLAVVGVLAYTQIGVMAAEPEPARERAGEPRDHGHRRGRGHRARPRRRRLGSRPGLHPRRQGRPVGLRGHPPGARRGGNHGRDHPPLAEPGLLRPARTRRFHLGRPGYRCLGCRRALARGRPAPASSRRMPTRWCCSADKSTSACRTAAFRSSASRAAKTASPLRRRSPTRATCCPLTPRWWRSTAHRTRLSGITARRTATAP